MFGLFEPNECPYPYTRKHLNKDIKPSRINSLDTYGGTPPLFCAVKHSKNAAIVKALIDSGADVNLRSRYGATIGDDIPTYCPENLDVVRVLAKAGMNFNVEGKLSPPLHYVSESDNISFVKILINYGADVNFKDKFGRTPVQAASSRGRSDILQLLIDNGGDVNNIGMGVTPLFVAILGNDVSLVVAGFGGNNPKINNIKVLIKSGADVNAICDGTSILELAYDKNHREVIDMLIKAGAK
jgi:ankyrin repeat protein